jgi:hypothetical protein
MQLDILFNLLDQLKSNIVSVDLDEAMVPLSLVVSNAAIVAHLMLYILAFLFLVDAEGHLDHAALICELEAIAHEVGDHLVESAPVTEHLREQKTFGDVVLDQKSDALALGLVREHLE